jgi:chemotaxis family two-component system sensor kinase Cph1
MSALVRDLLEYSRVSTTSDEDEQAVDLTKVMDKAHEWVRVRLEEVGGNIRYEGLPVVEGSEVRLVQVFRNLIENSIKYRREDVQLEISVSASVRERDWVVTVADNGQGFDPAFNQEIFDVFRRVGSREVTGSGIGLSICRTIVEAAGGRIWAEGRPGEGATFYISWPARISTSMAGGS